jgi:hypothetical protein
MISARLHTITFCNTPAQRVVVAWLHAPCTTTKTRPCLRACDNMRAFFTVCTCHAIPHATRTAQTRHKMSNNLQPEAGAYAKAHARQQQHAADCTLTCNGMRA